MGIYIKNMEMPTGKDVLTVAITADGEVYSIGFDNTIEGGVFLSYPSTCPIQAVPVPPHGRLIDADALIDWIYSDEPSAWKAPFRLCTADRSDVTFLLRQAPTFIPADKEGE